MEDVDGPSNDDNLHILSHDNATEIAMGEMILKYVKDEVNEGVMHSDNISLTTVKSNSGHQVSKSIHADVYHSVSGIWGNATQEDVAACWRGTESYFFNNYQIVLKIHFETSSLTSLCI